MHLLAVFIHLICLAVLPVLAYTPLSDETLAGLPSSNGDFNIKDGKLLAPILRTRIPGTHSIEVARQHFLDFFNKELPSWKITLENSTQQTALSKRITFVNIIATRDPPWAQKGDVGRLALVAHYDSKMTPEEFIGATDSAAPCAMLMHTARSIDQALTKKWEAMEKSGDIGLSAEKGVQMLLLDGEESFISWTDEDSLYGAR
jgi:glutaminyl-peptide cyclotransferase